MENENFVLKLWEQANLTASILISMTLDEGETYISKEILPALRPIMFKRFLIDQGEWQAEEETPADGLGYIAEFEKMVRSGEYARIKENPFYEVYCETVDEYINEARHKMDEGYQILSLIKEFSSEIVSFIRTINENSDGSMIQLMEEFIHSMTEKLGVMTSLAAKNS